MNRDPLSDAYRRMQEPGTPACPTPENLTDLVRGTPAGEERVRLADHVVSCRRCSEDVQILLATNREARSELDAAPSGRRRWLALAAAAVLAVAAAGTLLLRQTSGVQFVERGAARLAPGVTPGDAATLREPPSRFAWPAHPQAEGYRLKIFKDSGEVVWESGRLSAPALEIPPAKPGLFESHHSYYWVVEIDGPIEHVRLGPFAFRVGD